MTNVCEILVLDIASTLVTFSRREFTVEEELSMRIRLPRSQSLRQFASIAHHKYAVNAC
jgi:hypothetical protein